MGCPRRLTNRLGAQAGAYELSAMGEAYMTSLKFEYMFWEMAYNQQDWLA